MPSNPENMVTIHGVKDPGQTPSMGRMVTYRHHDGKMHPAIVLNSETAWDDEYHRVHLKVFTPDGDIIRHNVGYWGGDDFRYDTWTWRERVP